MFENLKLKALRKKLDKNLRQRDVSQIHSSLKTMAFLINEDEFSAIETLHEIASSLGIEKGDIEVLAFQKYDKQVTLKKYQINHKQIKWRGAVDNVDATKFLKQPFDVLLGYYNGAHPYLDFLISESAARFKVGLEGSDIRLYDLKIHLEKSDTKALKAELNKYLHVLGKVS